jgi:2-phosphoglycerate kinase
MSKQIITLFHHLGTFCFKEDNAKMQRYQLGDDYMLYLICGVAKSGKTYISNYLRKERGFSHFSTDYLMMALGKGNPELKIDIDADDSIVAKALEPYLYSMVQAMVCNGIDYILEGVHFYPDFALKLLKEFPDKIKIIYLLYPQIDTSEKVAELKKYSSSMENCWFSSFTDKQLYELVDYMKASSSKIEEQCIKYKLPYYRVQNIAEDREKILQILGL